MDSPPNILYIHSHDTGRCVQPYGFQVPTPNIQLLADQGVLFREAFCAAPTCSGSRASLLTGIYCHNNGMLGLAHRGWALNDYGQHWVHTLRRAGYRSTPDRRAAHLGRPGVIGYDEIVPVDSNHAEYVAPLTIETLRDAPRRALVHVGRLLRDPPRLLRPDLGPRQPLLAAAGQPAGRRRHPRGHGRVQGQRPLARPGDRRRPPRAARLRPGREHAGASAPPTTASLSPAPRRPCSTAGSG